MKKKREKKKYRFFRILGRIFLGLGILVILLLLFIRSPWGQNIIKNQVLSYVSEQTGTEVQLDRLYITFSGSVFLEGLYLEDQQGDTLVYSRELEAYVPLLPIIRGNRIDIKSVDWQGLRANVIRTDSLEGYNYQFLIDAFAPADTTTVETDTTGGMEFHLGDIHLQDFDVVFSDRVGGIDSRLQMNELLVEVEEMDLEQMRFHVGKLQLSNTALDLRQDETVQSDTTATTESESPQSLLPFLSIESLEVQNVAANYEAPQSGMAAEVLISHFLLELPKADLNNQVIDVGQVELHNSDFWVHLTPAELEQQQEEAEEVIEDPQEAVKGIEWPEWEIAVSGIDFQDNSITYLVNEGTLSADVFDQNAIGINKLNLRAQDILLQDQQANLEIESFTFEESSGIGLDALSLQAHVDDNELRLQDLVVQVDQNYIEGSLELNYQNLENFLDQPQQTQVNAQLSRFQINFSDAFRFQPQLRNNPYLLSLSRKLLRGNLQASGTLASVGIEQARVQWGAATSVEARGRLQNLTDPDRLRFDFPRLALDSRNGDLRSIVPEQQMNIRLPDQIRLRAAASGTPSDVQGNIELLTSSGEVFLDGNLKTGEALSFDMEMLVEQLEVGQIIKNEQMGALSMNIKASGSGNNINELNANLLMTIDSFGLNQYAIRNLQLMGEIRDGRGPVEMAYTDENLEVALNSMVFLDSVSPQVNLRLDVLGANLGKLGLSQRDIRVALELDGSFRGNMDSFDLNAEIEDGIAVYNQESYLLGDVGVSARVRPDSTAMDIQSQLLDMSLRSNTDPASFSKALNRHYRSYLTQQIEYDTVNPPVDLQLTAEIREHRMLSEIFLPSLESMDTINIDIDFLERTRSLSGLVNLPYLNFMGNEIDSLRIEMASDPDDLELNLHFAGINAGPVAIQETSLEGSLADQMYHFDFRSMYQDRPLMLIKSEMSQRGDTLVFRLDPSQVILNAVAWEVPEDNEIQIAQDKIAFQNFRLSRTNQLMQLTDSFEGIEKDHIALHFENFQLASLVPFLNPEQQLVSGRLQGNFIMEEPYGNTGMLADLGIDALNVFEVELGNLQLDATATGSEQYQFDMAIKGGNADLDLTGDYIAQENGGELAAHLALNQLNMVVLEGFAQGALRDTEGSLTGDIEIAQSGGETQYQGYLLFNDAGFNVSMLNAPFSLTNQRLELDQDGIYFDQFTLEDQDNNPFSVSGEVLTENMLNPSFDLQLEALDFMAMNSTADDNDLYYGKAVFDIDAQLSGTLNVPIVDLQLNVDPSTNLTYIIPESEVAIESREGVVMFVNKENPDDILTAAQEESYTFTGMDIAALLSIEEGAVFNIIIDEQTGDNLQVVGQGDLNFNVQTNGRTSLSGAYELSGGHYEMNLYGLVNRRFEIVEGSRITWAGDIFDANLDLRAMYAVETSASALMAARTTGAEPSYRDQFKQELPFQVYLNVGGELLQPQLSFGLDMPEEEQGAIGGEVYGRVQQVNQQEQELNKQVFSLLVLNRFYPEQGSDGSQGGAMALARDNLNAAVSDQLNVISGNLLGDSGFALDFGLDSYTDYQGERPEDRTQLDITAEKSFMDDRLVVRVGSEVDIQGSNPVPGQSTPLIGNVSIDYLITEEGQWRIRGFRRNTYENVIEGQIIVSGLSLIFTREFNEFRELWRSLRKDIEENQPEEETAED